MLVGRVGSSPILRMILKKGDVAFISATAPSLFYSDTRERTQLDCCSLYITNQEVKKVEENKFFQINNLMKIH